MKKINFLRKYLQKRTISNKAKFNKSRNEYNRALKEKKQTYYYNVFQKFRNNLKETWKNINKQLGKVKSSTCSSLLVNNKTINDSQSITNHFNDYFASVAGDLVSSLPQSSCSFMSYLPETSINSIYFYPTTLTEVKRIISGLKPKNSTGIDEIPSSILKSTPDNILLAITHIFNLSLTKGEFITDFKTSKIIPILKKGKATNVSNYRPISLLCTMSKILEKLVYNRVISFLNRQNFFFQYQFGFRKNHSTCHATTLLVENITEAFENKEFVLGLFIDLSKAFDTIDHKILLSKLWHYGIRGVTHQWFSSYLCDRKQLVEINGICSKTKAINFGVPQGSILGPLLFLIFVNDFNRTLTAGKCIMYADDTNIFFRNKSYKELFNITILQLVNIDNWLLANRLSLNVEKTHYLVFRTPHTKPPPQKYTLTIRNISISLKTQTKFLVVIFHEHINWKLHMDLHTT